MRDYELVVIIDSDLELDLDKPLKKIEGIIKDNAGKITKSDTWGKRKLAYPINKKDFGVYVFMNIQLPPENVNKVEGLLNITKEVIRYIVTNPVPEVVFPGRSENGEDAGPGSKDKAEKKPAVKKSSEEVVSSKKENTKKEG